MGPELIAFSNMYNAAYTVADNLQILIQDSIISGSLCTSKKNFFDVISKGTRAIGKRLMLNIACAMKRSKSFKISNIGFIKSSSDFGEGLTSRRSQASKTSIYKEVLLPEIL